MAVDVEYVIRLNDKLSRRLASVQKRVLGLNSSIKRTESGFSQIGKVATRAFAIIGAGAAIKNIVDTTAEFESLTNAIKFASGTSEEFSNNQKFLSNLSEDLGLNLLSTTEGFKTLSGSMLGLGFEAEEQRTIFSQVNTAVSAMGLSADQSKGALLALGQIMSKGKVQAEELRGQLGERLPGAFNIAARAMGVTSAELDKMLEQGLVPANEFLPKFAAELDKTFKGGLKDSVNSARANLNRFSNDLLKLKLFLGETVVPVILAIGNSFRKVFAFIKENMAIMRVIFKPLLDAFKPVREAISKLINKFDFLNNKTEALKSVFNAVGNIMLFLQPLFETMGEAIGSIIDVVVDVVEAFAEWVKESKNFQKIVAGTVNAVIEIYRGFARAIAKIFRGVGDILIGVFNLDFDVLKKGLAGVANSLLEGNAVALGIDAAKGFKTGFDKGFTDVDFFDKDGNKIKKEVQKTGLDLLGRPEDAEVAKKIKETPKGDVGAGIAGVTASAPKTFNINIESLIKDFDINTTNLQESGVRIKEEVTKALLTALTNTSIIAE